MNEAPPPTERQRYWLDHLRRAEQQGLPLSEYAKAQGLRASALYGAKSFLKAKGLLQASSAVIEAPEPPFSAVRVTGTVRGCVVRVPGIHLELDSLPSPQWLATLSRSLEPSR